MKGGELLLATTNAHKLEELAALLRDAPWQLRTPQELGLALDVPEDGATLEENAVIKAVAYAKASGLWALADDAGLWVDALGGAPGVLAKRFFGSELSDAERNQRLLERLAGVPPEQRTARYGAAVALASPDGSVRVGHGTLEGRIALAPRGSGGFGYDPIFELPELGVTVAELSLEEKNRISHRAKAVRQLLALLVPAERRTP